MASIMLISLSSFILLAVFHNRSFSCCGSIEKEKTLAMIKPDGLSGNYSDRIKKVILDSGFSITRELTIQLDEHTVERFYAEHSSKSFFVNLLKYMTRAYDSMGAGRDDMAGQHVFGGPVLVMVLEKDNAVVDWRKMIGPTDAEKARVTHPKRLVELVCKESMIAQRSSIVHSS
ncbi:hypothetical protein KSS87_008178 [Heliosperma pusillum]|nr:hypothetical protein KSS87_008178 [Heliosperma pusillum]